MALAGKKKIFDGKYEILGIVGRGSRSVVYHARNQSEGDAEVALKVLLEIKKDKLPTSEKLRREALAMVSSHHKYVVRLDDFHSVGDLCYLSMEYAQEADLRKYCAKIGRPLTPAQAELYLTQTAEALEYVHKVGIVHRDIKPDNILVIDDKSIRLGDFGVALLPGDDSSPEDLKSAVGTLDYMAPEVLEGVSYDQKSDIYSLGVTFYEMISGKNPFAAASLAEQLEVRKDGKVAPLHTILPEVPEYLSEVIAQTMQYEPRKRFTSAKELLQHLALKKIQRQSGAPRKKAPEPGKAPETVRTPEPRVKAVEPPKVTDTQERPRDVKMEIVQGGAKKGAFQSEKKPEAPSIVDDLDDEMDVYDPLVEEEGEIISDEEDQAVRNTRDSRAPTLFITKELTEKIRKDSSLIQESGSRVTQKPGAKKAPQFSTIFSALMFIIGVVLFGSYIAKDQDTTTEEPAQVSTIPSLLPATTNADLAFPGLPRGLYAGTLDGLMPDGPVSFTILSSGDRKDLTLLVGIDGWSPAIVPLADTHTDTVRVTSNGFILDMNGKASGDKVEGSYTNLITGGEGRWSVQRSKSVVAK